MVFHLPDIAPKDFSRRSPGYIIQRFDPKNSVRVAETYDFVNFTLAGSFPMDDCDIPDTEETPAMVRVPLGNFPVKRLVALNRNPCTSTVNVRTAALVDPVFAADPTQ